MTVMKSRFRAISHQLHNTTGTPISKVAHIGRFWSILVQKQHLSQYKYVSENTKWIQRNSISYLKYLSAETVMNFSMKSSESRTAIWAALPMRELAVFGKA